MDKMCKDLYEWIKEERELFTEVSWRDLYGGYEEVWFRGAEEVEKLGWRLRRRGYPHRIARWNIESRKWSKVYG